MANLEGFWSYVHADDEADRGRIVQLARDVSSQFEMLTGEPLGLFLDRDAIKWGEDWRNKIDASLALVAYFVPVMTPRYFLSAECRRELHFFARKAAELGIKELVLPLLYVDVPALHDANTSDDLLKLVRTFQWEDWRELRFADATTEPYRRAIAQLAARLVDANRRAEMVDISGMALQEPKTGPDGAEPEAPGFLDRMAIAEETLPKLVATIEAIGRDIQLIGEIMRRAAADIQQRENQAPGFAARLVVVRNVARQLVEPVDRVWSFGNDFASQLHEVDQGFRVIIQRASAEVEQDPGARGTVCAFFDAVRSMSTSAHEGLKSIEGMIDAIDPLEKMSRDLRPVLRRLRQGLTAMVEAREVTDEWVTLIDHSGVKCDGVAAPRTESGRQTSG